MLAAFSFRFFLETTVIARAIVGTVGGIVASLVVLSVVHAWESNTRQRQPKSEDKHMNFISTFRGKLRDISFEMTPRINIRKPNSKKSTRSTIRRGEA